MRTDKTLAIQLRLHGKSYTQIQHALKGISKSTLSNWLSDVVLSGKAQQRLQERFKNKSFEGLLKRNKNQTRLAQERMQKSQTEAAQEIKSLTKKELFYIGIALYWAEGYKRPILKNGRESTAHPIALTNSDANLIKIFIKFLREICNVPQEKIKANLRIFKHINVKNALSYWSKETGIPKENFSKTYIGTSRSSMNKRPFNRLPFGIIQIRINNTRLFHHIIGWINGLKDQVN